MSASMLRRQLETKQGATADAQKKAGEAKKKEAARRADAAKARAAAAKKTSPTMAASKLREAGRHEDAANTAAKSVANFEGKAAKLSKEAADLQVRLAKAEQNEREAEEKKRQRKALQAERQAAANHADLSARMTVTEERVGAALRQLPAPKPEPLRILMLAASSEGDLRLGREQTRIRRAVQNALHRNQLEFDVRPSATPEDLLDGVTRFRPHVVHFSGHSDEDLIVFEEDVDDHHDEVAVHADTFARAVAATDDPPLLVLLNSCHSAAQIDNLVDGSIAPFAIGMSDSIGDVDAIAYAAGFYAAVANGQSIGAAHAAGQVAIELAGLEGDELPTLAWADDVDPHKTILVKPQM